MRKSNSLKINLFSLPTFSWCNCSRSDHEMRLYIVPRYYLQRFWRVRFVIGIFAWIFFTYCVVRKENRMKSNALTEEKSLELKDWSTTDLDTQTTTEKFNFSTRSKDLLQIEKFSPSDNGILFIIFVPWHNITEIVS